MKKLLILIVVLSSAACAGPAFTRADGAPANQQAFDGDSAECEALANSYSVWGGLIVNARRKNLFRRCMSGRGWAVVSGK